MTDVDIATELETLLVHADDDPGDTALSPPIHQSVPYSKSAGPDAESSDRPQRFYRRYGSPTQARLERVLAAADGGEAALATASGMGAISTTLLALVGHGGHIVAQHSMYGGTLSLLRDLTPRLGIDVTLVDQTNPAAFAAAIRPSTKLVMLETPSNPLLQLTDIAAVSELAHQHQAIVMIDNTVATPLNQRPLEQGVDIVMYSLTKAISGHSDVLAGAVIGSAELISRIWHTHTVVGAVISPFDAWLALRGLRTMPMRVRRQNHATLAIAEFLAEHPDVRAVNYPGLGQHPQHALATSQMAGFGSLLSVELDGGHQVAEQFIARLRIPTPSPSLGGAKTTVVRPAEMWAKELTEQQLAEAGVPAGLVRLAVGLEHEKDLIADLDQALAR